MAKVHIFSFLFVRLYLNDTLFFDYQGLSLQAVLFLVPKNVSESCFINDTYKSFHNLFKLINTKHSWMLSGEAAVQNAEILSPGNLKWSRCWMEFFFSCSMSYVNSIFSRPNAWRNQMSNKLFSCSEFQVFVL